MIYLHIAEADVVFLMDIFERDEQGDLTADQKKALRVLADSYNRAAIQAARSFETGTS